MITYIKILDTAVKSWIKDLTTHVPAELLSLDHVIQKWMDENFYYHLSHSLPTLLNVIIGSNL